MKLGLITYRTRCDRSVWQDGTGNRDHRLGPLPWSEACRKAQELVETGPACQAWVEPVREKGDV